MPESAPQHLFVYGTLTRGSRSPFAALLEARARYIGDAWVPGRLYRLGNFPGAVPDPAAKSRIWGNLYWLKDPMVVAAIDRYEGCGGFERAVSLFRREAVRAVLGDGRELDAWMYRFTGRTEGRPVVHPRVRACVLPKRPPLARVLAARQGGGGSCAQID